MSDVDDNGKYPPPEDDVTNARRKAIRAIMTDTSIPQSEKTKKIQALMAGGGAAAVATKPAIADAKTTTSSEGSKEIADQPKKSRSTVPASKPGAIPVSPADVSEEVVREPKHKTSTVGDVSTEESSSKPTLKKGKGSMYGSRATKPGAVPVSTSNGDGGGDGAAEDEYVREPEHKVSTVGDVSTTTGDSVTKQLQRSLPSKKSSSSTVKSKRDMNRPPAAKPGAVSVSEAGGGGAADDNGPQLFVPEGDNTSAATAVPGATSVKGPPPSNRKGGGDKAAGATNVSENDQPQVFDASQDDPRASTSNIRSSTTKSRPSTRAMKPGAVAVKPGDDKEDAVAAKTRTSQRQADSPQVFDTSRASTTKPGAVAATGADDDRVAAKSSNRLSSRKSNVVSSSSTAGSERRLSGPEVFDSASSTAVRASASSGGDRRGDDRESRIQRKLEEMDSDIGTSSTARNSSSQRLKSSSKVSGGVAASSAAASERRLSGPEVFDAASTSAAAVASSSTGEDRESRIQRKLEEMDQELGSSARPSQRFDSSSAKVNKDSDGENGYGDDDRESRIQRKLDEMMDDEFIGGPGSQKSSSRNGFVKKMSSDDVEYADDASFDDEFEYSDEVGALREDGGKRDGKYGTKQQQQPSSTSLGQERLSVLNAPVIIAQDDHDKGTLPDDVVDEDGKGKNRLIIGIIVILVIVGVVVGVVMAMSGGGGGDDDKDPTKSPTLSPTQAPTPLPTIGTPPPTQDFSVCFDAPANSNFSERYNTIRGIIEEESQLDVLIADAFDQFDIPNSSQRMALCWIADYDDAQLAINARSGRKLLQRYTVAVLNYAFVGEDNLIFSNWLTAASECEWEGIGCSFTSVANLPAAVSNLTLDGRSLSGPIPLEITDLGVALVSFNIEENNVNGTIPDIFWYMPKLISLVLAKNPIGGTLSTEVGNAVSLVELKIDNTNLVGPLPTEMGNVVNLEFLDFLQEDRSIAQGGFNGTIPSEIGSLTKLKELYGGDTRETKQPEMSQKPEIFN